ncbi:uncharacterized protein LOC129945811 [Eupeodes corollae]|uniref:uncharacterized protein LOC129945811 n=1 Tax=Eupeodes corollae TaxID=290404 RepID=UPI002491BC84|nr:uncharacterized protein LOC129945811 [Eupeodes corollae]
MFLQIVLVIAIVAFIVENSQAATPEIPCPDVFQYSQSKGENVGIITVNDVDYGDTVVDIKLSQLEDVDSDYVGKLSLNFDINKSSEYIETGTPFTYKVRFALEDVIPRVEEIKLNGLRICFNDRFDPEDRTTIDLQHTLTVPQPFKRSQKKKNRITTTEAPLRRSTTTTTTRRPITTTSRPTTLTTPTTTTTTTIRPISRNDLPSFLTNERFNPTSSSNRGLLFGSVPNAGPLRTFTTTTTTTKAPQLPINFDFLTSATSTTTNRPPRFSFQSLQQPNTRFNFISRPNEKEWRTINRVCGLENSDNHSNLVVNGTNVPRSKFPWIAAIFKRNILRPPSFQCGGSLITSRTVISAAHCFDSDSNEIPEKDIVISVGRHNLDEWSDSDGAIVNRNVEKIIRHPDYDPSLEINDADIAIVQLEESVMFTVFVRPVCMWEGVLDVSAIVDIAGIIVGWGRDEDDNAFTKTPKLATATVVDEVTCVKSHTAFIPHTSKRTLCAGNRDGSGPCKGDSGSGLVINVQRKWRLRGTVARSLSTKDRVCDLEQYVVYTDVAQFLGWIYDNSVFYALEELSDEENEDDDDNGSLNSNSENAMLCGVCFNNQLCVTSLELVVHVQITFKTLTMVLKFNLVMSVILVTVLLCLCKISLAQTNQFPNSPCPNIFQYARKGNTNIGIITVNDVSYGATTLAVELSQQGYMELQSAGRLSLNFNNEKIYEYIDAGRPFTFRLDFPVQNIIPKITSIKVNDIQICHGIEYEPPRTNMQLEFTLNVYSTRSNSAPIPVTRFNNNGANDFTRPSNLNQGRTLPDFLKYSPSMSRQMSTNPSPQHQPSSNRPPTTPERSFNNMDSNLPSFLRLPQPSFKSMTSNMPSFLNQPPNTQQPFQLSTTTQPSRPRNIFLDAITPGTGNNNRPANPPPTFGPPLTPALVAKSDTSTVSDPIKPIFTSPTTINSDPKTPIFTLPTTINSDRMTPTTINSDRMTPIFTSPTTINSTPRPQLETDGESSQPFAVPKLSIEPQPMTASTDGATLDHINTVCGQENDANQNVGWTTLNVGGTPINKSRFPWIVAIFKRKDDDFDFQCGGSLISTRTVVSAAHCFYEGKAAIGPEEIVVSMGVHNLTDRMDARNIDAKSIIVHPDYTPLQRHFDADLAIVRLVSSVTFTPAIRPICMWQGNKDQRELVGMRGMIVGWGSDGRRKSTIVPTLVKAFVVEEITCIKSNANFLTMTSSRTLCAGSTDGSGPCLGDSGNGFMLRNQNKWTLRGTVSAAPGTPVGQCVLNDYAIYADVAMFVDWIQSNMLL